MSRASRHVTLQTFIMKLPTVIEKQQVLFKAMINKAVCHLAVSITICGM